MVAETLLLGTIGNVDDESTRRIGMRAQGKPRRCPTCETVFTSEPRFCPFDGEPLVEASNWDPAADPILGKTIDGRYEVRSVIGGGGMGTVYHVRHVGLDRGFALKLLRAEHAADRESVDRFLQEARVAASIGHENLVSVTDFGEVDRTIVPGLGDATLPYFVMDRLEGESLAQLLRRERRLAPKRTAEIVRQCASGLSAAHAAGVVHRDLKPDNVFLVRQGNTEIVKLLDFGIAKILGASRLTRAGTVYGTPHYMSPEQASGQPVDARADIYALGVILYECLAGSVPFSADTFMGVLTHHMFSEPEPLESRAAFGNQEPDSPVLAALAPIAMRCLAKKPEERFESMQALADGLRDWAAGIESSTDSRPSSSRRGRKARSESNPDLPMVRALPDLLVGRGWAWLALPVGLGLLAAVWFGLSDRGSKGAGMAEPPPSSAAVASRASAPPVPHPTATAAPPTREPLAGSAVAASASAPTLSPSIKPGPRRPGPRRSRGSEIVDPWAD